MKKGFIISFLGFAMLLGACSPNASKNVRVGRAGQVANYVPNNPNQLASGSVGQWGTIQPFTMADVVNFVSTGMTSNLVGPNTQYGATDAAGQPCQVDFNISMDPGNGNFNPIPLNAGQNGYYQPASSGILTVAIYDTWTGNGMNAIAAAIPLAQATMTYNGNSGQAQLNFQDSFGTVTMAGNISGEVFTGTMSYTINTDLNTNAPFSGQFSGPFATNICYVFQCQSY